MITVAFARFPEYIIPLHFNLKRGIYVRASGSSSEFHRPGSDEQIQSLAAGIPVDFTGDDRVARLLSLLNQLD